MVISRICCRFRASRSLPYFFLREMWNKKNGEEKRERDDEKNLFQCVLYVRRAGVAKRGICEGENNSCVLPFGGRRVALCVTLFLLMRNSSSFSIETSRHSTAPLNVSNILISICFVREKGSTIELEFLFYEIMTVFASSPKYDTKYVIRNVGTTKNYFSYLFPP